MESEIETYRSRRDSDPSYTAKRAVGDYLSEHEGLREKLVWKHQAWYSPTYDDTPMDWDSFEEYLKSLDQVEAFKAGTRIGHVNWSDEWYHFDGNGNVETLTESQYQEWLADYVHDYLADSILDGDGNLPIPREMADVLVLWVDEDELCVEVD